MASMDLEHARLPEQRAQMEQLIRDGICPFCRDDFEANHRNPIILEKGFWLVSKNDFPYAGSQEHLILVHKKHVTKISEIDHGAWAELGVILAKLEEDRGFPGGTFMMRFGSMDYTGATIAHLHAHIVVGVSKSESEGKLLTMIGYAGK